MNLLKGILFKLISTLLFALMSALVRFVSEAAPVGQIVFFRSAFGILPVVLIYAYRRELASAVRTRRPLGHIGRGSISVTGMFLNFGSLARLPLVDATAIGFAAPFITVVMAALILREPVRIFRWSAVIVGFGGVIVMLWPHLNLANVTGAAGAAATIGALFGLGSAFTNAASVIQTRRLTATETTASIVFYFSLISAIGGLLTLPFGWHSPTAPQYAALISIGLLGGVSHIVLTESYRHAPASVVAPFDYTAMIWAFLLGYWIFGEVPTVYVFVGAVIVAAAGLFVIWREGQLGLLKRREKAPEGPPAGM